MDRIVYRGLAVAVGLLKKAYFGFIFIMIMGSILGELSRFIDYVPIIEQIYNGFVLMEIVGVIFYFVLGILISVTERQVGLSGSLAGTEMWQIVRSWKYFKEDIMKDALILNGFTVTLSSLLLNWMVK